MPVISPVVYHSLTQMHPNVPICEAYASTEAAHQLTSNPIEAGQQKPSSVGKPFGTQVCIRDLERDEELQQGSQGEICARGANITSGYLNNPEANKSTFTQSGWMRSGDLGYFDQDGYLFLSGRIKEQINSKG